LQRPETVRRRAEKGIAGEKNGLMKKTGGAVVKEGPDGDAIGGAEGSEDAEDIRANRGSEDKGRNNLILTSIRGSTELG
jgi:hypothetical protein